MPTTPKKLKSPGISIIDDNSEPSGYFYTLNKNLRKFGIFHIENYDPGYTQYENGYTKLSFEIDTILENKRIVYSIVHPEKTSKEIEKLAEKSFEQHIINSFKRATFLIRFEIFYNKEV
jgi:hypothetical protein